MRNITISLTDDIYRTARVWAAERDTHVSAVVQYLIESLPDIDRANRAFPMAGLTARVTAAVAAAAAGQLPEPVPSQGSPTERPTT